MDIYDQTIKFLENEVKFLSDKDTTTLTEDERDDHFDKLASVNASLELLVSITEKDVHELEISNLELKIKKEKLKLEYHIAIDDTEHYDDDSRTSVRKSSEYVEISRNEYEKDCFDSGKVPYSETQDCVCDESTTLEFEENCHKRKHETIKFCMSLIAIVAICVACMKYIS